MNIQSLSIVVPTKNKCINHCKFCVSRTHTNPYNDVISALIKPNFKEFNTSLARRHALDKIISKDSQYYKDYFNRLQFARDNGCNTVVLTGTGEPIQNPQFLDFFSEINSRLTSPFKSIELQTTGVLLDKSNLTHLRRIGVTTISFSISNIVDNLRNLELIGCAKSTEFNVFDKIALAKELDFNIRLSINLVNDFDNYSPKAIIDRCKFLGADQVTFRKLYKSESNSEIDKWIDENASKHFYNAIVEYVKTSYRLLTILPFGANLYDIDEMSICVDDDCMASEIKDTYKYLVLRENAKLYFRWETKSSLVF